MPRPDEGVSRRRLIAGAGAGALGLTALGSRAAAADPGGATAASVGRPVHHRLVPGTVHGVYSGGPPPLPIQFSTELNGAYSPGQPVTSLQVPPRARC